ncbi:MAG TPA: hypothetical protein VG798_06545 [Rhizomicrobium sp.]|nr:hypothetical protein [Rhizomicrobium sp.]
MRTFIPTILALALAATPAMAQSTDRNGKTSSGAPQAQTVKPSQNSNGGPDKTAAEPQSKPAQDNSMADYNVLGSTAQAAFGHDGP